jgi:hypothetical protein
MTDENPGKLIKSINGAQVVPSDLASMAEMRKAFDEVCGIAKDWTHSEKVRARIDELRERFLGSDRPSRIS